MRNILVNKTFHENDIVAFAESLSKSGGDKALKQAQSEIARLNKRKSELDTIINRMYEDYALGSITAERYQSVSAKYEQELKQVRERLDTLNQTLSERENQTESNVRFLESIQKYTDVEEITRSMLVELVDKIVIFNGEGKGKNRQQQIDIYYRFSGIVDVNEG